MDSEEETNTCAATKFWYPDLRKICEYLSGTKQPAYVAIFVNANIYLCFADACYSLKYHTGICLLRNIKLCCIENDWMMLVLRDSLSRKTGHVMPWDNMYCIVEVPTRYRKHLSVPDIITPWSLIAYSSRSTVQFIERLSSVWCTRTFATRLAMPLGPRAAVL